MESYDMVTWKAADPASGTVVSYTNDGTANTGFVSEQTEPLGQSISLTPPPAEPQPPTYEAHLFDAYDPEWQCSVSRAFYGGFGGMPDHCQNKILKDLRIPLTETFGWHASTVTSISFSGDSALARNLPPVLQPGIKRSKEEIARLKALAVTGKFDNEAEADSSLPSDVAQRLDAKYASQKLCKFRKNNCADVNRLRGDFCVPRSVKRSLRGAGRRDLLK